MSEIREGTCQLCSCDYPVWFAPNHLWNAAMRQNGKDEWSFLCPTCFANVAAERGVHTGAWVLTDEVSGYETAASLAYVLRELVIQGEEALMRYREEAPA